MTQMPKQVFILGLQRSGTTWLANMLAALPQVAAVADARHRGVHESVFFSHFAAEPEGWHDPDVKATMIGAFKRCDYVQLSGLAPETVDDLAAEASGFGDLFIRFMDRLAYDQGAAVWIEKSPHHTLLAEALLHAAPDCLFVMVQRKASDLVASRLHGFGRTPQSGIKRIKDILRGAMTTRLYEREMAQLAQRANAVLVRYEDLKSANSLATRQHILDHIGLQVDPAAMISAYSANSSFDKKPARVTLSLMDRSLLVAGRFCAGLMPLSTLRALQTRRARKRGVVFPKWVWTIDPAGSGDLPLDQSADI